MPNCEAKPVKLFALSVLILSCSMFGPLAVTSADAAGFPLNFQPGITNSWDTNNMGACGYGQCAANIGNSDPTPFAENIVTIDNVLYFHTITGDPTTGFAIEAYTRAGPAGISGSAGNEYISSSANAFGLDGGANLTSVIGNFTVGRTATTTDVLHNDLNSSNPLGDYRVSGTGGNAPDHTAFRMVMTSPKGDMSMEVSKPFLDKKPMITQTVQDGTMTSSFVADERGLNYSQDGTAAPVTNTLVLNDPTIPGAGAANFSMAQSQQSVVTAGRFTFTAGTGWNDPTQGWNSTDSTFGFGTYDYSASGGNGFQPLTFDWGTVFDYAQNANACSVAPPNNGFVREQSGNYGGSCFNKP